jgi:signal transduction histidine kinase/CheY-like chemotaxis protein
MPPAVLSASYPARAPPGSAAALARWPTAALILGLALLYFAAARLGLLLAMPGGHVTPVWPPAGVALAALLLCGRRVWPGIWLGSFAANLWDFIDSPMGLAMDLAASASFGVGASAAALLGAHWIWRFVGEGNPLDRVRGVLVLMALGSAASSVLSATMGVTTLCWAGFTPWAAFGPVWLTWWLGDAAGACIIAPLLLAWQSTKLPPRPSPWLQAVAAFSLLLAATAFVFINSATSLSGKPLAFIIIPFLVWPALRFGALGATSSVVFTAALAVWGTINGWGPFAGGPRNESLLLLELFLSVVVLASLCIAALMTERSNAERAQRRAYDELSRAWAAAEQATRAKSDFLATMSHEIRTPMNGVVGMIDVLEHGGLGATQVEIVKTIRESAHALLAIVDDVLDFSKIEAGELHAECEAMDVAQLMEGVCDTLAPLAGKKAVVLTLFTEPAVPALLAGDATRLRQVLLNLAGNAIKFSGASAHAGRVAVRSRWLERALPQAILELSVSDNGIGMDPPALERLFAPFTQADASTTRRFGGTGLGLSISRCLVDLMGGALEVRSALGEGSTFTVRLPLAVLPTGPEADALAQARACELAGLCCWVLGAAAGPADDWASYLGHSGARVHRALDLAAAQTGLVGTHAGPWIVILADGISTAQVAPNGAKHVTPNDEHNDANTDTPDDTLHEALAQALASWRGAAGASQAEPQGRFVVVEPGHRRAPFFKANDLVSVSGAPLHRRDCVKAVALAAGRITAVASEQPAAVASTLRAPLSLSEARAQGRLILVAEDNEVNQEVLCRQLALLGFAARVTSTGGEALECWRRGDHAMLLTDLHMPQMDGYELAVAIRAEEVGRRRMPIIALTANALGTEATRCRELGMDDYMTKPVQLARLSAMLSRWLPGVAQLQAEPGPPAATTPSLGREFDVSARGSSPADAGKLEPA